MKSELLVIMAKRRKKISQLSKETGISRTTLTALCNDKAKGVTFEVLDKLCIALDCSVGDILQTNKD